GTLVIYTVVAVGTFVTVGLVAPVYVPIVGISALLLLQPAFLLYKKFDDAYLESQATVDQVSLINRNCEILNSKNTSQIHQTLHQMGINWMGIPNVLAQPANIYAVNPLIARHQYLQTKMEDLEAQKEAKLLIANKFSGVDFHRHRQEIYDLVTESLELEKAKLETKLQDAFVHAVIRRPSAKGALQSVGKFSPLLAQERIAGNAINDPAVNNMFIFNNRALAPLTLDDVKRSNVNELAYRLLAAMAA
ncbi:MAG: hypothetical protein HYX67_02985, partial [Candidatus Melainabacteria bacterium]|nr:hypothetical protein [Candidatus Melainabacteria bacterium]